MKSVRPKMKSFGRGSRGPVVSFVAMRGGEEVEDDPIIEISEEAGVINGTDIDSNKCTDMALRPPLATQAICSSSDQNSLAMTTVDTARYGSVQKQGQHRDSKSVLVEEELKLAKRILELEWREQELEWKQQMMKEEQMKKSPRKLLDRQMRDINLNIGNKSSSGSSFDAATGVNDQEKQVKSSEENLNLSSKDGFISHSKKALEAGFSSDLEEDIHDKQELWDSIKREMIELELRVRSDISDVVRNQQKLFNKFQEELRRHQERKWDQNRNEEKIDTLMMKKGATYRDILVNAKVKGWNAELKELEERRLSERDVKYEEVKRKHRIADQERARINIPVSVTGDNRLQPISKFSDAGFSPLLLENIKKCGYREPSSVQKHAIPIILAGRDLMACAQTGTGKTTAFLLPIIQMILSSQSDCGKGTRTVTPATPQALVIAHTRELAIQIYNEARQLTKGSMVKPAIVCEGTNPFIEAMNLGEGCDILVATVGRLLHYVDQAMVLVCLSNIGVVVFAEADMLLDIYSRYWLEMAKCLSSLPWKRQTLMFSVTFPHNIQKDAQRYLQDYFFLTAGLVGAANGDVIQNVYGVGKFEKRNKIEELLVDSARHSNERTLIFVAAKKNAEFLASHLSAEGVPTTCIHSGRDVEGMEKALHDFKVGEKTVLVATSEAARGLHLPGVVHVINYDMTGDIDDYKTRIGNIGVSTNGKVSSFLDPEIDEDITYTLLKLLTSQEVRAYLDSCTQWG